MHRLLLIAAALFAGTRPSSAQETEIVRGRVLGPLDVPLMNALVTVTGAATQAERTTRTDSNGVYAVLFASPEHEYAIRVRALGFSPRVTRVSGEGSRVVVADVRLAFLNITLGPVELDTVVIAAARPAQGAPGAGGGGAQPVGGHERDVSAGFTFALDPSDIVAVALASPGVHAVVDAAGDTTGFSVLGAPPEQNATIVDGSSFGGRTLPRDAIANVKLATTTFDPGRGGFSGGQMSATTRRGTDAFTGDVRGSAAEPWLSWADPASPDAAPSLRALSGSAGGPIRRQRAHYLAAVEVQRATSPLRSLLQPRAADLRQHGLSADSVAAVRSALDALGIPLTAAGVPAHRGDDRQALFLRLDVTPGAASSLTLRLDGTRNVRNGQGLPALAFPSMTSRTSSARGGVQLAGSFLLKARFLDEFQSYAERSRTTVTPHVPLPGGIVTVATRYPDGREGLAPLRFGGPPGQAASDLLRWETRNELSWLAAGNAHRVKLGQSVTIERTSVSEETGRYGTFTYPSLAALAANAPASYARRSSSRARASATVIGALWGGDEWRVSDALRLQYGARLDLTTPASVPPYNPSLDSLFGARTDRLPTDAGVSPRVGFSWTPPAHGPASDRAAPKPLAVSGGVGAFRGVIPPSRLASVFDATGLATTGQSLQCVGDATPVPDWTSLATAVPGACADGASSVEYSAAQPNAAVFHRDFTAPVSWRATVTVERLRLGGWTATVTGTHSVGVGGESAVDLNLRDTAIFTLPDEGRPVYVSPTSIVPATGAIAPGGARLSSRYVRVASHHSELRTVASQLSVTLTPPPALAGRYPFSVTYVASRQRLQARFGPEVLWSRGAEPAHQAQFNGSGRLWWLNVAVRVNVTSGIAYTPLVAADVDGDGTRNDRAFVFEPGVATDSVVAAQMRALLASAPRAARSCLERQLGRIATPNSCRTGWQFRPDVNLRLEPPARFGMGDRLRVSATLVNASGALFRLFGLSSQPFARAGSIRPPDATLLYVTGFDDAARRFRYQVNQRFGEQRDVPAGSRGFAAPFQVQVGAEYRFGPSRSRPGGR